MTAIENSGLLNVCNNCANGLVPMLSWSFNAETKVLTITDSSVYSGGDGLAAINVEVHDKHGNVKHGQITVAGGNVQIDLNSEFNENEGFNITATIVTESRNTADLAIYLNAGITQTSGTTGVSVEEVSVSPETASIVQGETQQFSAEVLPEGVSQAVTWTTEAATGLSVNSSGLVSTTGSTPAGEYTITATSNADNSILGTATLTVTEA